MAPKVHDRLQPEMLSSPEPGDLLRLSGGLICLEKARECGPKSAFLPGQLLGAFVAGAFDTRTGQVPAVPSLTKRRYKRKCVYFFHLALRGGPGIQARCFYFLPLPCFFAAALYQRQPSSALLGSFHVFHSSSSSGISNV